MYTYVNAYIYIYRNSCLISILRSKTWRNQPPMSGFHLMTRWWWLPNLTGPLNLHTASQGSQCWRPSWDILLLKAFFWAKPGNRNLHVGETSHKLARVQRVQPQRNGGPWFETFNVIDLYIQLWSISWTLSHSWTIPSRANFSPTFSYPWPFVADLLWTSQHGTASLAQLCSASTVRSSGVHRRRCCVSGRWSAAPLPDPGANGEIAGFQVWDGWPIT